MDRKKFGAYLLLVLGAIKWIADAALWAAIGALLILFGLQFPHPAKLDSLWLIQRLHAWGDPALAGVASKFDWAWPSTGISLLPIGGGLVLLAAKQGLDAMIRWLTGLVRKRLPLPDEAEALSSSASSMGISVPSTLLALAAVSDKARMKLQRRQARVERRLQEQGRRVAELERVAEDRRRLVEDLLRELRHQPVEAAVPCVPESVPPPEEASPEDDSIAEAWATAVGEVDMLRTAVAQLEGELTGARWRNAELHTAVAELLEETQDAEAEAERLRGALEIAQVAAEEATRALAERDGEASTLRSENERLAPLAEQANEVSRLVDELRRQAGDLKSILEAREAELAKFRASASAPGAAAEALAARLDMLRGAVDAVHERLARLREDPRAYAVVADLDDIGTALNGALNASG